MLVSLQNMNMKWVPSQTHPDVLGKGAPEGTNCLLLVLGREGGNELRGPLTGNHQLDGL